MSKGLMLFEEKNEEYKKTPKAETWNRKYKPRRLSDVVFNSDAIKERIYGIIESADGNIPNLILKGTHGTGKTTTAQCIALYLLDESDIFELSPLDDTTASIDRIDDLCMSMSKNAITKPFNKIIILDDFDNMSMATQHQIKETMDKYINVRFIATCVSTEGILDTFQSRCTVLHFHRISDELIYDRLKFICGQECFEGSFDDEGLKKASNVSQGDMRKAIDIIYVVYNGLGEITYDSVMKLCEPNHETIAKIQKYRKKGKHQKAWILMRELENKGYFESAMDSLSMLPC